MANTYTQIHIQTIFAVQDRQSLIQAAWREELYRYLTGIVQNHGHKMLQVNGMPDHVHLFIGMRPAQSLSDLMKKVKGDSSEWINKRGFTKSRFSWQAGYGAFSYAKSQVPRVIRYIQNQEEHHRKKSFTEEYLDFLKAFEIEYEERFIFKSIE
ncbi:IS200/IS605 family transposase [Flavilitoribacter nigricans]|uniref:Transposase n=1 Tax=Flavilitoribacter nigricans (strain ATCC 23147 / DSM 23189 / NBRC 102662 / NCIMB 1420 / SS-2) TaxID=1122177 RepID=A0A2D0NCJ2_FLAN2|nr:IS200/IS605 family transposase [Flavilitoribacter nigricans]PHN06118.1 transposase [Flavilitoribacter nigricans DSM 23189 = NBRC 102662]